MAKIINILTIFPDPVEAYLREGMLRRASDKGLVEFNTVNIRDFSLNRHRKVDDIPYGGGPGMVMGVDVTVKALESLDKPGRKVLLSPSGKLFTRQDARRLGEDDLTLICGRYMGIDHRIREFIDETVSVGEYILSGGELPALTVAEAVTRLIPGVLGDERSLEEDRGYPIYTRPREFRGFKVPDVLLSGDRVRIKEFREREAAYGKDDRYTD